MIYEKNLEALKNKYGTVYNKIVNGEVEYNAESAIVEEAKNGEKIIKYKANDRDIYLNSRYNPSNEAHKYMNEAYDMPDESILIMYGLSNGAYVREYLNSVKKKTSCIIYEPGTDIFMQVIHNIDISDLIASDRVYLVVNGINEEALVYALENRLQVHNKDTNKNMAAPHYIELYHAEYQTFKHVLIEMYEKFYIMTNTAIQYGKKVVYNDIYNMKYLPGCRSVYDLIGKFPQDMPAIIVAAGPSLDKNIELLKEAKGKAFIIVVDTAIIRVQKANVIPDMIISIDMEKPVEMFKGEEINRIPFVTDMAANVEVFDYLRPENLFFCSSDSVIWDDLFRRVGNEIRYMRNGGSVATAAISLLIEWGFKRIVLMGMDLGFTENKLYAGGECEDIELDEDRYTYVQGINGENIMVRKDYYIYLRWLEDAAGQFPDIDFIDATEGGTRKKNTRVMTLRDVIDNYCVKEYDVGVILESAPRLFEGEDRSLITDALKKMKKNLQRMKKQLTECMSDCRMGKLILERGENDIKELKRIKASIKKTDEMIEDSDERIYIYKYLAGAEVMLMKDMYIEEDDHIKESIRMYEKSIDYYEEITKGIPEIIKMIDDCIVQIGN